MPKTAPSVEILGDFVHQTGFAHAAAAESEPHEPFWQREQRLKLFGASNKRRVAFLEYVPARDGRDNRTAYAERIAIALDGFERWGSSVLFIEGGAQLCEKAFDLVWKLGF